jgi:tRNA dimethylallyltransferase
MTRPIVIAVVGPTCSGKTRLGISIATQIGGEILCADSRTIYRHMDIGTAKPTASEQEAVRHHLIDLADPDQTFTLAQFQTVGLAKIDDLHSRGVIPVVVGGTGLYTKALLQGLRIPQVQPDEQLRKQLQSIADTDPRGGDQALRQILEELDPVSAQRIGPNDIFRLIRAIEVSRLSGAPFSDLKTISPPPFDVVWFGLTYRDRSILRTRIAQRLQIQLEAGLVKEVDDLKSRFGVTKTLINTVAYKQILAYIDGQYDLNEAMIQAQNHTQELARRQMMWFRANKDIMFFDVDDDDFDRVQTPVLQHISRLDALL